MSGTANTKRLVIVGASLAGLRAAEGARASGFTGEIIIIGQENHLPYDRPPLSKQCLAEGAPIPYLREEKSYAASLKATLFLGEPATALNPLEQTVVVGARTIAYDALVIATGATPRQLPGHTTAPGIVTLRNADDTDALRQAFSSSANITIIGAGIIGAEIASAARARGCSVTIVEATPFPLERAVGRQMGTVLSDMHRRNGTDLQCGVTVQEVRTEAGKVTAVLLNDGTEVATDLLLVSIGVTPNTTWLKGSGIDLLPDGSIACNEYLQTSVENVYAAGDVMSWPNALTGRTGRLETWTSANEQGVIAGNNAVTADAKRPYATVPYFWSDWYGHRIQFAGSATDAEPEVVLGSVEQDKYVALYRQGDRVVGALAVNEPAKIMKDRRRIQNNTGWDEAVQHYRDLEQKSLQQQSPVSASSAATI